MTRRVLLWVAVILACVIGISGFFAVRWILVPLAPSASSVKALDIPEGATFKQVAVLLEKENLIASRWGFLLLGKLTLADRRIIPGEYELHAGMRPHEILAKLLNGQIIRHQVTIPEGYTMAQIADLLEQKGLADAEEFLALANDRDFILTTFHLNLPSLEGYLFPDTYFIARHTKAKEIITMMVEGLWRVFTPEMRERAKAINMSVHEILTLASVIEKETGSAEERELVSSVFHNRLRKRIPLQSDPTVIYGISNFDGNLRKRDLRKMTPYNTYRIAGLPPGPIASPGAHAIRAALYPPPTTYLYFVSKNDGSHHFSSTLAEHNWAVEKYQRRQFKRAS